MLNYTAIYPEHEEKVINPSSLICFCGVYVCVCVCVCARTHARSVTQSCPILWDPKNCSPPGSSVHGILQAKMLEWVALIQGIFPTQGLNFGLLCCRWILYHLSHQGSPCRLEPGHRDSVSVHSQFSIKIKFKCAT